MTLSSYLKIAIAIAAIVSSVIPIFRDIKNFRKHRVASLLFAISLLGGLVLSSWSFWLDDKEKEDANSKNAALMEWIKNMEKALADKGFTYDGGSKVLLSANNLTIHELNSHTESTLNDLRGSGIVNLNSPNPRIEGNIINTKTAKELDKSKNHK